MKNNTSKTRSPRAWVLGGLASLMMSLPVLAQHISPATSPNVPITIIGASPVVFTAASPYPSIIDLTGAGISGPIEKVTVSVTLTHNYTRDVGLLLVGPDGTSVVLMNHAGTGPVPKDTVLTFDDQHGTAIGPTAALTSSTYLPTDLSGPPREDFVNASATPDISKGKPPLTANCATTLAALIANLQPDPTKGPASVNGANGKWALYVQDDSYASAGSISSWSINIYTGPSWNTLSADTVTLSENDGSQTINFTLNDYTIPSGGFKVTLADNSGTQKTLATISPGTFANLSGTLTFTPVQNVYGTNVPGAISSTPLVLTVDDQLGLPYSTYTTNINVQVAHVNQPPSFSKFPSSVTLNQGQMSAVLTATLSDADFSLTTEPLVITVTSDNPSIVSATDVFLDPTQPLNAQGDRTFTIIPNADAVGSCNLTFTVTDTSDVATTHLTATAVLPVTINAAPQQVNGNPAPIILSASTATSKITPSGVAGVIASNTVVVNGLSNVDPKTLQLLLTSTKGGKVVTLLSPNAAYTGTTTNFSQLVFVNDNSSSVTALPAGGTSTSPLLIYAPNLNNVVGDSPDNTWTLTAVNGAAASGTSQIVNGWVINFYIAPIITLSTSSTTLTEGDGGNNSLVVTFSVSDRNGYFLTNNNVNAYNVSVASTAGPSGLIGITKVFFNPTNQADTGTATLTSLYAANTVPQFGTSTITVSVTDNNGFTGTTNITVNVPFQNHQPSVTFVPKQLPYAGVPTDPIPFTVSDVDAPSQTLTVTVSADNQKFLPNSNIILTQVSTDPTKNATTYTLVLYPVGPSAGSANVFINVDDGSGKGNSSASTSFPFIIIGPGNPQAANLTQINIPVNSAAGPYPSTVTVSGLIGTVSKVTVDLFDLEFNQYLNGLHMLLVSPDGTHFAELIRTLGDRTLNTAGNTPSATLILEDGAPNLPTGSGLGGLVSGTFAPTQGSGPGSVYPPYPTAQNNKVPIGPYGTSLSAAFNGLSGAAVNGTWSLYVYDDSSSGKGALLNGWQLSIITLPNVQPIGNTNMLENSGTTTIPVLVGDLEAGVGITVNTIVTPVGQTVGPVITATPNEDSSGNWTLALKTLPFVTGTNQVEVSAHLGNFTSPSQFFFVTNVPTVLQPVIIEGAISPITLNRASLGTTTFHVWDPQNTAVSVAASSGDVVLGGGVSSSIGPSSGTTNFVGGGTYPYYPVTITVLPASDLYGPATVSVTVSDAATPAQKTSTSFAVTVNKGGPLFANLDTSPLSPILIPMGFPLSSNAYTTNFSGAIIGGFPSTITVAGLQGGYISGLEVTLVGLRHPSPGDLDVLLVAPDNKTAAVLMAHVGDGTPTPAGGVRLTFDQVNGATLVPGNPLVNGTYLPLKNNASGLQFSLPKGFNVATPYGSDLSVFTGLSGANLNGTWSLFVMADNLGAFNPNGSINNWLLSIQTSPGAAPIGPQTTFENVPLVLTIPILSDMTNDLSSFSLSGTSANDEHNYNTNFFNGSYANSFNVRVVQSASTTTLSHTNLTNGIWQLTVTPTPNFPSFEVAANPNAFPTNVNVTVDINLTATDGNSPYPISFPLTVLWSNIPPVITTTTPAVEVSEGTLTTLFHFFFHDPDSQLHKSGVSVSARPYDANPVNALFITNLSNSSIADDISQGTSDTQVDTTVGLTVAHGTNLINFSVTDGNTLTTLTVTQILDHVYQAPLITGLKSGYTFLNGGPTLPITFTVSSIEGVDPSAITVTATSDAQSVVPDANISVSSPGKDGTTTIVLTPLGSAVGTANITVTAADPTKASSQTRFAVLFLAHPGLVGTGPINITPNGVTAIPLQTANLVGNVYNVQLEFKEFGASNPNDVDILLESPDGTEVMVMSGAGGTAAVTNLDLLFDPTTIKAQQIPPAGPLQGGTPYLASYYSGTSRLPLPAPFPAQPAGGYQATLRAFQDQATANGTWTLYINDAKTGEFEAISGGVFLNVITRPVLRFNPAPVVMGENAPFTVNYTVADAVYSGTFATNLTVAVLTSDNKGVMDVSGVSITQPDQNGNGTVTLTPVYLASGTAHLVFTVTRPSDLVSQQVTLTTTVTTQNFPPIIYRLVPRNTGATQPINVPIVILDLEGLGNLTLTAAVEVASAPLLSSIYFLDTGTNTITGLTQINPGQQPPLGSPTLHIVPAPFAHGTALIDLTVTDPMPGVSTNVVTATLQVGVGQVFVPPVVTNLFDLTHQSVTAGSSTVLSFAVSTLQPE